MVDRINLILKAKNLTSRQFAEEIGIQPSGMSHILSGRNRPSLDFVMKVVTRYPEIDIKWLTLGEGEMYVSPYSMPVVSSSSVGTPSPVVPKPEPKLWQEPDLFSSTESSEDIEEPLEPSIQEPLAASDPVQQEPETVVNEEPPLPQIDENRIFDSMKPTGAENKILKKKRIMKVVILYDDHSFSEYYPE